jgi:hypothetical protein
MGEKLPPIKVAEDSTLKWTNNGDLFQIFEDSGTINVNSQASSGDTFVPAGTYTLDVNAVGAWTITITPA